MEIEVGIECARVGIYSGQSANRLTADGDEVAAKVEVVANLLNGQHHCRCVGGEARVQVAEGVKFGHAQRKVRGSVGFPASKSPAHVESVVCGVGLQLLDLVVQHGSEVGVEGTGVDVVCVQERLIDYRAVLQFNLGEVTAHKYPITDLGVSPNSAVQGDG